MSNVITDVIMSNNEVIITVKIDNNVVITV